MTKHYTPEEVEKLQAENERLREALEYIAKQMYPSSIFKPFQRKDWNALRRHCEVQGYPLDRLSGEYGRMFTASQADVAKQALGEEG